VFITFSRGVGDFFLK